MRKIAAPYADAPDQPETAADQIGNAHRAIGATTFDRFALAVDRLRNGGLSAALEQSRQRSAWMDRRNSWMDRETAQSGASAPDRRFEAFAGAVRRLKSRDDGPDGAA